MGCDPIGTTATETNRTYAEACKSIGETLPTRSRKDTQQTQDEIERSYQRFGAVCPDFVHLIPRANKAGVS